MRRVLDPISSQEILSFAKKVHQPWEAFAAVTLTDGETIVGHLGGSPTPTEGEASSGTQFAEFTPKYASWQFLTAADLVLCHRDLYTELRLYIPLGNIAGIRQLNVRQPVYSEDPVEASSLKTESSEYAGLIEKYLSYFPEDERPLRLAIREQRQAQLHTELQAQFEAQLDREWTWKTQGFNELLLDLAAEPTDDSDTSWDVEDELQVIKLNVLSRRLVPLLRATALQTALRHDYRVDRWPFGVAYSLSSTVSFTGDFEPRRGERLYVDWEYISQNREGLNSAGFGFVVSLSLSWKTSDARSAKRLAKRPFTTLTDACQDRLTLISGHVAFLEIPGSAIEHDAVSSGNKLSMDGSTWRAAVICALPIAKVPAPGMPWVLSYWKEGREEVPFQMLDTSVRPLDIFGSVHSGKLTTSFGETSCFLKVHYAQAAEF